MIPRSIRAGLVAVALLPVLAILLIAGLPLAIVSVGTRRLSSFLSRKAAPARQWMQFEPVIGWKPTPDLDIYHRDLNGDLFRLRTGSDGWRRGSSTLAEADVVVFGDSFAFGTAVDDGSFFGDFKGKARVKAIGAPGYNMVQEYLLMSELGERLRGKLVVWFIYLGNDLDDNLRPNNVEYRTPFVREGAEGWEIVTEHVSEAPWPFKSHRLNYETWVEICTPSHLSRRALSACDDLLRRGGSLCRSVGAEMAVVTIPDLSGLVSNQIRRALDESPGLAEEYDPRLPDRHIRKTCDDLGCEFAALADHMSREHYREHDVHWNGSGHGVVYRTIERLFETTVTDRGGRRREPAQSADQGPMRRVENG